MPIIKYSTRLLKLFRKLQNSLQTTIKLLKKLKKICQVEIALHPNQVCSKTPASFLFKPA